MGTVCSTAAFADLQALASKTELVNLGTGTVQFTGQLLEQGCKINIGSGSTNQLVDMGTSAVPPRDSNGSVTKGHYWGATDFTITFEECPTAAKLTNNQKVYVKFSNIDGSNDNMDTLKVFKDGSTSSSDYIGIQISPKFGEVIKLNDSIEIGDTSTDTNLLADGNGKIDAHFTAHWAVIQDSTSDTDIAPGKYTGSAAVDISYH
ncbi:fimbrial protein [Photobacterium sp. SKA34]|uniref:fimbrial protein n=1 Tax=Photobacterium sp. SKA34 TaxID=121723 RepID=UPI0018DE736D|nr:type 1 fimbrial protein [Photobacterium sp. SKA34]